MNEDLIEQIDTLLYGLEHCGHDRGYVLNNIITLFNEIHERRKMMSGYKAISVSVDHDTEIKANERIGLASYSMALLCKQDKEQLDRIEAMLNTHHPSRNDILDEVKEVINSQADYVASENGGYINYSDCIEAIDNLG